MMLAEACTTEAIDPRAARSSSLRLDEGMMI